jgi:Domain of unknown function (DUF4389)
MSKTIDRPPETVESLGENLAQALDEGVGEAVAALPPWVLESTPGYPVQVTFEPPQSANRFWAIPLFGFLVKLVVLIPHLMALAFLMAAVALAQLVLWIPVFNRAEYPAWGQTLVGGTIRWAVRVEAFFLGLTDKYPPFSLGADSGVPDSYPVRVTIPAQPAYSRAWAIPVAGLLVKVVLLIPHFIILRILQFVVGALQLVLWIPVLFKGNYPTWGYQLVGGYIRWSARVTSYLLGLTDQYPPFHMG